MHPFYDGQTFAGDVALALKRSLNLPALRQAVAESVAKVVADPRVARAERVFMAGSGDSLFAAIATAHAFRRWTGLATEARSAVELARYDLPVLGPRDLVVSISNSGNSSRAREAIRLAKDRGVTSIGVTGSLTGALAREADLIVHRPVYESVGLAAHYERCFLNLAEYLAVLYALYALAAALAERRGLSTGAVQMAQIERAIEAQAEIAARVEPVAMVLAETLGDVDTIWAIGAGPSQGTARYSAAKFHEQMPINGIGQDLEEWAHLEYFLTLAWGARSVVLVVAPPGNSFDRAQELVQGIDAAGGRAVVIHSRSAAAFPRAFAQFDMGFEIDEWLSPLVFHLPAQLLVLHMAARAGVAHIPLRRKDGGWLIAQGVVRESAVSLG
jgi:glutamine---fructose-6-phosphate transaminase (isomerizing)